MRSRLWRLLPMVVILSMVIPVASLAEMDAPQANGPAAVLPGGSDLSAATNPLSKLDSELRDLAAERSTEPVLVYILAKPGADLSGVADVIQTRPYPPDNELIVANLQPEKALKMASNPDVVAAEVFHAIEAPIPLTPKEGQQRAREEVRKAREKFGTPARGRTEADAAALGLEVTVSDVGGMPTGGSAARGVSPEDWYGVGQIGAPEAWAKGYTGEGVNVAIIDSGVDFGNPDLENNVAFYDGGPYDGWPIALDPRSMRGYFYNGYDSWDNYYSSDDYSWYAGVYDQIPCTDGMTSTFEFNGSLYVISADIAGLSKSGAIRWGVHPDPEFWYTIWNWVPFIMVDASIAGDYDTVIADMNFDYWFDEYDDTAVLGTDDPVLNQDLGRYIYTDTYVLTGTQYIPDWWWAQAPPTWGGWFYASSPMTLTAGAWIWALDHYAGPDAYQGADGIADVSGGMVYYIADGKLPIPGMDYLYPTMPPSGAPPIPAKGQLAAFMLGNDWVSGGDHGTLCASAATAAGVIKGHYAATGEWVQYEYYVGYDPVRKTWWPFGWPSDPGPATAMSWLRPADEGQVQGPGKGADVIALGNNYQTINGMQGFYDSYTFLAYGVDGVPNSGDEFVQIASMSYGDGSVHNDGWDWESRLISFYNQNYLPNTTWFASSGNGGYGFGTVNSPQGNTTVTVGASSQYGASDVFGGALELGQLNSGDVSSFSGRGPDALGRPDPDVIANGAWGAGDAPLNTAIYDAYFIGWAVGDGNQAWYEWGGTSRAGPEAAGVMSLVYDAYKQENGSFPDFETARQILMSGADDQNHDVLMQGAGRVNADRATDVAGGLDGVYVTPSMLAAGEYDGTHYESFANVLYPGDTWSQTFTVSNPGTTAKTVTLGDEMLMEMEVLTYTQVVSPFTGMEDPTYPNAYYYYANYFVGADPTTATHGDDMVIPVPAGADFMEVHLVVPFEIFDFSYNDPDPFSVSYNLSQRWSLTVYDWTDRNDNDLLWDDTNGDHIVNPVYGGDIVDISYTGPTTMTEINRFSYSYNYANVQEVTVKLDETREDANVVLGLVHRNNNNTRPGWGSTEYHDNPLMVKVVFYEKMDWDLVDESAATASVPAGGSATFDATFDIPADQPPGLYEGAITVDDGTHTSIIPTTVNVAVPSDDLLFTLGGTAKAGTPYDNGRMVGGYTWASPLEQGDWRFYYYDADAGFGQQYLYVVDQWGNLCGNMPTANETLVWGPNPGDQFSMAEPDKYGPYGNQFAGGTWGAYGPQNGWYTPRRGDWWIGPDGPLPETRIWASLWDGLNQVQFRNILMSGKHECGEGFEGTAGVFGVDVPEPPNALYIETDDLSGSFTLDAVTPVDGLYGFSDGLAEEQIFRNQDVPQGKHTENWPADLMDGWVYTFEVTNTWGIEAHSMGPYSSDVDLYLLYDANHDGMFNPYSNEEALVSVYMGGSDEWLDFWGSSDLGYQYNGQIPDGTYAIVMYGYAVNEGDTFDLSLWTYGGEGVSIEGATADNNYLLDMAAGVPEALTVNYDLPGTGVWSTYLAFAMPEVGVPEPYTEGPWIWVPVTINAGGAYVEQSSKTVDKEIVRVTHEGEDHEILTYLITVVNNGDSDIYAEVYDLLPANTMYYEQTVTDVEDPDYGTTYVAKWWFENGEYGYFWPDDDYIRWDGPVGPTFSGKLYIEYKVKVKHGFVGTIDNKADVSIYYDDYAEPMELHAYTDVRYTLYLPSIFRNEP
jgi:uncharacterized repeat protein (TIGR01451 family)